MRPVSDAFLRTVRGSHRAVFDARVVAPGQTGVDPDGTAIKILSGDVSMDANAAIRSTLDLTTEGGLWPARASDLLAPYGNEIFVRRGIAFGGGATEWVSLGYFRIESPEQEDAPFGAIRVAGRDRMAGLADARLLAPRQFTAGVTLSAVFGQLVGEVYPGAVIEWDDNTDTSTLGRSVIAEEDRHAFLADLVVAAGKIWFWDHRGVLVIKSPPDPATPVVDVDYGQGGVLVSLSRRLTREGVYNAVVATGEGADTAAPARGVAVDGNPHSPTYWDGPFGKVPRFYSSPFITTDAQARAAAASLLQRSLGLPYAVDFSAVPNPAVEPDDPIRVRNSGSRPPEIHVIERMSIGLTVDAPLTASTREQTAQLILTNGVG
ncbi:DUF5047 domain-containing protein [Micromonospora sp. CPCC 205371]|nr:DUF5047 domain-containing protein [Micromonospora sp. CPCC 205371]